MGTAIHFAVRDGAGSVQNGTVAGEGQSNFIQVASGDSVSLNISQASVVGYEQQGRDLIVKLADGRTVTLVNYFNVEAGEANHLFLSHDDQIMEVVIRDGGNGALFADYGPVQGFEKWSPLDHLKFSEADPLAAGVVDTSPAGMAPLIPGLLGFGGGLGSAAAAAAVIGGGAAIIGGGGGDSDDDNGMGDGDTGGGDMGTGGGDTGTGEGDGDGGDTGTGGGDTGTGDGDGDGDTGGDRDRAEPTVDPRDKTTLTTNTDTPSITVTGTGEPGDSVTVTIGDKTETTTIDEDGTWGVTFPTDNLPDDGDYSAEVVVTTPGGDVTLTGPETLIDMTPPDVAITEGAKSTGDVENATEYTDGVSISGSGEAGATIVVEVAGSSQSTTVGSDGTWTVTFTTDQVTSGEYETGITVTATDVNGNVTTITDTLVVDTVPNTVTFNSVTSDNTVNLVESQDLLTLTGSATAGATLTFTIAGVSQTVTAGSDGSWSASWPAGTVASGTYSSTVTVTSADAAGNVTNSSHTFNVDTQNAVAISSPVAADNIVNLSESTAGVTLTGTGEAGSTVKVTWNGTTVTAPVSSSGSWSAEYASVPGGTYSSTVTVVSTDVAGNTATATKTVAVDTEISVALPAGQTGGDDTVSGAERAAGIALTGTAEAGSIVSVSFAGATKTVTASSTGTWTASFGTSEIPSGTTSAVATVTATDAAGNTATATRTIAIDTEVKPFTEAPLSTGGDGILNKVESAAGLTITGTVEAGSTVKVTFGSYGTYTATVSGTTWVATIPAGAIPQGAGNTVAITAVATDAVGNTSTLSSSVKTDTLVENFTLTGKIGGDGYINALERADGVLVSGTVEAGSTVVIDLGNGHSVTTVASSTGAWSATIPTADLPTGEGTTLAVTITATDVAGNVSDVISQSVVVDTVAPDSPDVSKIVRDAGAMTGIYANIDGEDVTFHQVDASGETSTIAVDKTDRPTTDIYDFDKGVADGSYLVIENTDVAGNSASTLFIVNNTNTVTVDLNRAGLSEFDFTKIDLTLAPQASLTIDESQLKAITGEDHQLTVAGGSDDSVNIVGGVASGNATVDGESYTIYTLGTGNTLLVDDDIHTTII